MREQTSLFARMRLLQMVNSKIYNPLLLVVGVANNVISVFELRCVFYLS